MKTLIAAPLAAGLLLAGLPAAAQTTAKTEVKHDTNVNDSGVVTRKTKVTHTTKHKTHRPKKVLGVKVGHKTVTHKTERETSVSSDGSSSSSVKTN